MQAFAEMAGPTLCSMPLAGHSFYDHDQKVEIVASSQEAAGSAAVEHPASQNGKEHSFPVFDLEPFLKAQQQASALSAELMQYCQSVAETLRSEPQTKHMTVAQNRGHADQHDPHHCRATGCLLVRDPRVQVQDNLSFLNMMERYFEQPAALKMADVRSHLHYQVCTSVLHCCSQELKLLIATGGLALHLFTTSRRVAGPHMSLFLPVCR